jgi:hypothetical protein
MLAHSGNKILPEFVAAFLVNAFVADHRKLLRARRHKNQDGISLGGFLHSELEKFLLRPFQRILLEFPALEKNADLPGRLRFGVFDRADDPIVLDLPEKSMRAHLIYQLPLEPPPPKLPPPPLNPLKPPPDDEEEELLDQPLPQPLLMNGPPKPV